MAKAPVVLALLLTSCGGVAELPSGCPELFRLCEAAEGALITWNVDVATCHAELDSGYTQVDCRMTPPP